MIASKVVSYMPINYMEIDDLETPTEQSSSTAQKKRSNESGDSTEKSSNKKAKKLVRTHSVSFSIYHTSFS